MTGTSDLAKPRAGSPQGRHRRGWSMADCDPRDLERLIDTPLATDDVPFASETPHAVPVYEMGEGPALAALIDRAARASLLAEWAWALRDGPGVLVLRGAYRDTGPVDRATSVFDRIIAEEAKGGGGADHFAAAGANARVWNAAGKLCERDPETFALYFGNVAIAAVCEAWLGPAYQMTAQVNLVRPGGAGQSVHRDYHLGFQSPERTARWPVHAHAMSAALTLQGAVAHCDMPVESGPTRLLPFSQSYGPGYLAAHDERFADLFERRAVQLPLAKGDALFFNPALFHAAGSNHSAEIERMANLLQISSAFGRAMETLDRPAMARRLYPALQSLERDARICAEERDAAIAACAEGYPFPTNLETDPPAGGNAPESDADLMRRALTDGWSEAEFDAALTARAAARRA